MRKYALEMLKKQDDKLSLKRRRKKCGRNIDYLPKVLRKVKSHAPALLIFSLIAVNSKYIRNFAFLYD